LTSPEGGGGQVFVHSTPTIMFTFRTIRPAARLVWGQRMKSAQAEQVAPQSTAPIWLTQWAVRNKEMIYFVGFLAAGAYGVRSVTKEAFGWESEIAAIKAELENRVKNDEFTEVKSSFVKKQDFAKVETSFVTKEDFAKVETEVKSLATKEAVGKVETEVKNILQSARLEGENAALRVWKEKEASVAGARSR
jgi:hypothetical protein